MASRKPSNYDSIEDEKLDNEENEEDGSQEGSGEHRWNTAALDQMDFVCTFLDNEEDNLPELFDTKSVVQQKADNCGLCQAPFSGKMSGLLSSKDRQKHHCKRCGAAVCGLCSGSAKRRLSKIDKKKYRVCDECDTLMSNVNFD